MTFLFEEPEPSVVAGVNWPVLEYLIERFNRSSLEGCVVLRRTSLLKDLQLCLSAECDGKTLSLVSETFEDELLTVNMGREQLIRVVSRFLLKAKHQHAELFDPPKQASCNSLSDVFRKGSTPANMRRDVPDNAKTIEGETFEGPEE